jgi:RNA polymerase sigma-70 factor (ECF subfamily)
MYAAITDTQVLSLIPACQRGDSGAVERLYDLYADRIYHYVLARTGEMQVAEDLTAEVFLRVIQHVHHFKLDAARPSSSVSAWLYRIAANLVADHHRARQRRPLVSIEEDAPFVSDSLDLPAGGAARSAGDALPAPLEIDYDQRCGHHKFGEG